MKRIVFNLVHQGIQKSTVYWENIFILLHLHSQKMPIFLYSIKDVFSYIFNWVHRGIMQPYFLFSPVFVSKNAIFYHFTTSNKVYEDFQRSILPLKISKKSLWIKYIYVTQNLYVLFKTRNNVIVLYIETYVLSKEPYTLPENRFNVPRPMLSPKPNTRMNHVKYRIESWHTHTHKHTRKCTETRTHT